jgi:hypothetical protein
MYQNKNFLQTVLFSLLLMVGLSMVNHQANARMINMVDIGGVVIDAGGKPATGTTVFIRGETQLYNVVTDDNGAWSVGGVPVGEYKLYAIDLDNGIWPAPRHVSLFTSTELTLTLAPVVNSITAGDFEAEDTWQIWQRFNGEVALSTEAFDGQAAARLGTGAGEKIICSQNGQSGQLWSIKQRVELPADNQGLSFIYQITTSQNQFDYAWLEVVLMADGKPTYLTPWGDLWQESDWTVQTFDLSAWRGQTVELLFQTVNCADKSFVATIDRVSLGEFLGTRVPTSTPMPTPSSTPFPIQTPNPNAKYTVNVRQLTPCENEGKHHLFIYVEDAAGNGIPDVSLRVFWPDKEIIVKTGSKQEHAGLVDFAMFKGSYWVELLDGTSDVVGPLTPDIPKDVLCEKTGNPVGNSLFHYSYNVIFRAK